MAKKGKRGRLTMKDDRRLIAIARAGGTASGAAEKLDRSIQTIQQRALKLGLKLSVKKSGSGRKMVENKMPLAIRVAAAQKRAVQRAAAEGGMSVAQFVEKALVALLLSADISRAPVANAFGRG